MPSTLRKTKSRAEQRNLALYEKKTAFLGRRLQNKIQELQGTFDDTDEVGCLKTGTANQTAIDIGLTK